MISLDIFADPICPWSYIGKAYLDRALERALEHPFQIRWLPFMLNPLMPAGGMDRDAYLEEKFGDTSAILDAYGPVVEHAEKAGIDLDLPAITRTPSTINAHRLIHWAGIEERASFVIHRMMQAYFRDGRDIGDTDVLVDIATAAQMDADMVARLLRTDADRQTVVEQDASARGIGVTSSPTFIVGGKHVVAGAQPSEMWDQVIAEIKDAAQA